MLEKWNDWISRNYKQNIFWTIYYQLISYMFYTLTSATSVKYKKVFQIVIIGEQNRLEFVCYKLENTQ